MNSGLDETELSENEDMVIDVNDGPIVYNNWTDKNIETVRNWKSTISSASYMYDYVLEKYKKKLNRMLIAALIVGAVSTVISAISSAILAMDDKKFIWVAFVFNVVIFVTSAVITVLNSIIKITGWEKLVNNISRFIEKLDAFYATISSELVLPVQLRQDAIEFIKKERANFVNIMKQSPDIYPSDYEIAHKKYLKYVEDNSNNFKYAQKFADNDSMIDII